MTRPSRIAMIAAAVALTVACEEKNSQTEPEQPAPEVTPGVTPPAPEPPSPEPTDRELDDVDITNAIETELIISRGIDHDDIDVTTVDGVVTLGGTAKNLLAKRRALRIAESTKGVRSVVNDIRVMPTLRSDARIRAFVESALVADPATESYEVTVAVDGGEVTLRGEVESWQERKLAEVVAMSIRGVTAIRNELDIDYGEARADSEIARDIEGTLAWDARIDDALIEVSVEDGAAKLAGTVGSAYEKRLATESAWVRGVREVDSTDLDVEWWARDAMLRKERFADKTDAEIERAVDDALLYDPRASSFDIGVDVDAGVATLTGVVDNFEAKRAAAQDAANTIGVWHVRNRIKVRTASDIGDAALARAVESALDRDPYVTKTGVAVIADDGEIRLTGAVDSYFEKWQATDAAGRVNGVERVDNDLTVDYEPRSFEVWFYDWDPIDGELDYAVDLDGNIKSDWALMQDIAEELYWSPFVDRAEVDVRVDDGVAILTGTVDSWRERAEATEEAYEGGAIAVENDLAVEYGPDAG